MTRSIVAVDPDALTTYVRRTQIAHRVHARDGFVVGTLVRVKYTPEGATKDALRWAARCSPMAFSTSGLGIVPKSLYAPVPGSVYLPGRHTTQLAAQLELESYLRERDAPGLGV
jgi:hypothetical protein